jgi:hypothetical protein
VSGPRISSYCSGGEERWLPVPGQEGSYEVSDHGRVRSLPRIITNRIGIRRRMPGKVLAANGCADRSYVWIPPRNRAVHQLVLEAFVGPRPEGLVCCHRDDNSFNNHLSNLRWDTPQANERDKIRNGRHELVNRTHCPRNHLLALPNLQLSEWRKGHRVCLACHRGRARAKYLGVLRQADAFKEITDRYYAEIMTTVEEAS